MLHLERRGSVCVLRMDDGENRFTEPGIARWNALLDEVAKIDGPKALVTTGTGRFYSNGLDVAFMSGEGRDRMAAYVGDVMRVIGRVLTFPAITVAAVNGHAFGAGAQLAVAHDFRFMRADRGFFCMPEIDMRAPLHPGMTAVLKARLPVQTLHEVVVTGRRWGGADAEAAGIVERALPEDEVLDAAVEQAAALAEKADPVMTKLKLGLYAHVLEAMERPLSEVLDGDLAEPRLHGG